MSRVTAGAPRRLLEPEPSLRSQSAAVSGRHRRRRLGRHQLSSYSPIPAAGPVAALAHALRLAPDPRPWLRGHLLRTYQADGVALCGSGTDALRLAIAMARRDLADGAPVALPAFSCYDIATAALGAGAEIILYDIDPLTLGPDWDSLAGALEAGARVVVAAPLYGLPVDWETLTALARQAGAVVIEDVAQGDGAAWRGRALGALGELSVLSFARGKGWTGFRGGALLARGRWVAALEEPFSAGIRRELSVALGAAAQQVFGRPALYGLPATVSWLGLGETRYRHPAPAIAGMSRAAAALLRASQDAAAAERGVRKENAQFLLAALREGSVAEPMDPLPEAAPGYLRLPVLLPETEAGLLYRDPRAAALGVARSFPASLGELAPVQARIVAARPTPGAAVLARRLFTLPTHGLLRRRDLYELVCLLSRPGRTVAPVQQAASDSQCVEASTAAGSADHRPV